MFYLLLLIFPSSVKIIKTQNYNNFFHRIKILKSDNLNHKRQEFDLTAKHTQYRLMNALGF